MVRTSRQAPSVSASATAVLALATSLLSRLSASGRPAVSATTPRRAPPPPPPPPPSYAPPPPSYAPPPPTYVPPPAPPPPEPPPGCWCCINGKIVYTTPAECRAREGQCYPTREEAERRCQNLCW